MGEFTMQKLLKNTILLFLGTFFLFSCKNPNNFFLSSTKKISFQLQNGKYISSDRDKGHKLFSNGDAAYEWETFSLISKEKNLVAIKTSLNYYVSYNNIDSILVGNRKSAGDTELFILTKQNKYYELHSLSGDNVIVDKNGQLRLSNSFLPEQFKISKVFKYPALWFSLKEIDSLRFLGQLFVVLFLLFLFFRRFKKLFPTNLGSHYAVFIIGFILIYVVLNTKQWQREPVIDSDGIVYYEYLPAAFIFNDMSFQFADKLPQDFDGRIWAATNPKTGRKVPKMTMGLSYMYAPFFFLGHITAHLTGFKTYGYSLPYSLFICIGAWFYVFLSLFYLRKILLFYFNDVVTSLTLFSVVLATNLFYYTTLSPIMSHAYSFSLFVFFIYYTITWHNNKTFKTAIKLGLLIGLISLIRPTNALLSLVFVLFGVASINAFKNKTKLFWDYKKHIVIITLSVFLVWLPQLLFWKYTTTHWFYFSYGDEGFFFNNPHIIDGLFSYRKGWLLYTPIMAFALLGIVALYKIKKEWSLPILLFTVLNIYIVFSWWCWWYGGGFGGRPLVESHALLAIALAAFFSWIERKHAYYRSVSIVLVILASSLNLFQTLQTRTCLHYDSMTKEAYWTNFTTLGYPKNGEKMLKTPDYDNAVKGLEEYK